MTERAYTAKELVALRSACETLWIGDGRHNYKELDRIIGVEELVRTHMMAGHTAEDLKPVIDEMIDKWIEREEAMRQRAQELHNAPKASGMWR